MDPLKQISELLISGKSVVLVGMSGEGKTYWVQDKLIPMLQKDKKAIYFKDGDCMEDEQADIYILDEAETLFDREYLEKRHPDEKPYYQQSYLDKVNIWHKKYSLFTQPSLYIITRNELPELEYLAANFNQADWDNREVKTIIFSPYLYHGSATPDIKTLEPRHRYSPAGQIAYGAIYATPVKAYAAAHSFPWSSDEGVDLDVVEGKVIFAVPKEFKIRLQQPISIYKVSAENFTHTKEEETGRTWHTTVSTPVLEEEKFESVESALNKLGAVLTYK